MYYHICSPKIPLCYCCVLFTMWKNKKFTLNWKKFRENSITNYNTRRSYKNVPVRKENQPLFLARFTFFFFLQELIFLFSSLCISGAAEEGAADGGWEDDRRPPRPSP